MCRFTIDVPVGGVKNYSTEQFADDFNWFDAIDDVCAEEEDAEEGLLQPADAGGVTQGVDLLDWFGSQYQPRFPDSTTAVAAQAVQEDGDDLDEQLDEQLPALQPVKEEEMSTSGSESHSFCQPQQHQLNNEVGCAKKGQAHSTRRTGRMTYYEPCEDKVERVKQKRRESAQRSRARKNAYMKELENENAALKAQVASLHKMVGQLQTFIGGAGSTVPLCY